MAEKLIIGLIILLFVGFFLCACSSPEPQVEELETLEQKEAGENLTVEASSYIFEEKKAAPKEIVLTYTSDPIQISSGYLHLTGIIKGRELLAAVEVAGQGRVVGEGERVGEYLVTAILDDQVMLERTAR